MTVRDRLHELVDRLSDDEARRLLTLVSDEFAQPAPPAPTERGPDDVAARVDAYLRRSQPPDA